VEGPARPVPADDPDTGHHDLRAACIWSSEEAASVREARERALARAGEALTKIRNGLGGRYCKTRKQADARVAQILTGKLPGLIQVTTSTRAGKRRSPGTATRTRSPRHPGPTGCTPWPPACPTTTTAPS
jgi:hypothetical protein